MRSASRKNPDGRAASRRLRYAVSGSRSPLGRYCSFRLLPSGAVSRAQQSAVICRDGLRAIRAECDAQGAKAGARTEIGLVDTLALQRYGLLAVASRPVRYQKSAPANPASAHSPEERSTSLCHVMNSGFTDTRTIATDRGILRRKTCQ